MEFKNAPKIVRLNNADIHVHYANNKGRGCDNVTLTIVKPGTNRLDYTRLYQYYMEQLRVSGWRGKINIPTNLINKYGGLNGI